jgi:hypothetical protein
VYGLFDPNVKIGYDNGRRYHSFTCLRPHCRHVIRRFLDGSNAGNTSGMGKHARTCWGDGVFAAAKKAGTAEAAGPIASNFLRTGKITDFVSNKNIVTYSTIPLRKHEVR